MRRSIAGLALSVACARPSAPVEEPAPIATASVKTRTLEKDETVTTASGATFTASAGWTVEERADAITLVTPEGDLRLTYVEVTEPDRDKAIATAWSRVAPGFALKVADAIDMPPSGGWDADYLIAYVTSPAERREVYVDARLEASTWFIALIDGNPDAIARRNAQLLNTLTSLKVKGSSQRSSRARKRTSSMPLASASWIDSSTRLARWRTCRVPLSRSCRTDRSRSPRARRPSATALSRSSRRACRCRLRPRPRLRARSPRSGRPHRARPRRRTARVRLRARREDLSLTGEWNLSVCVTISPLRPPEDRICHAC